MLSNSFLADYLRNGYGFEAYMYDKHYNNMVTFYFWCFLKVKSIMDFESANHTGPLLRNIIVWNCIVKHKIHISEWRYSNKDLAKNCLESSGTVAIMM